MVPELVTEILEDAQLFIRGAVLELVEVVEPPDSQFLMSWYTEIVHIQDFFAKEKRHFLVGSGAEIFVGSCI